MKISEYGELFTPAPGDYLVIVQGGTTYKVRLDVLGLASGGGGTGLLDPAANGLVIRNAENVTIARSLIAPAAGLAIANPDGVAGPPTFSLANDLAALEALSGPGYPKRAASPADTWALMPAIPAGDISGAQALTGVSDPNVTITLGGSAATAVLSPASITLGWAGQLSVARGGTGAGTLANNGILYGGGIGPISALAPNAAVTNKFLTQSNGGAPAWATITPADLPGGFSGFANPSTLIGLAVVNGSTTTAMRSDAAPALSQAIAPTWTAAHTFTAGISMAATKITNLAQAIASTDALAAGRTITEGAGLAGNTYDLTANRTLALGLPSTLTVSTVDAASGTTHAHAITSSSNPGAAAMILATDASGYLTTVRLTVTDRIFVNAAVANFFLKDTLTGWQSASSLVITPQINNSIRSTNFTAGLVGWGINAIGDAEFNNIVVRGELRASVFKIQELAATAGTFGVFYSASTNYADVTTPGAVGGAFSFDAKNSDAGGMLFGVGDPVRWKAFVSTSGVIIGDSWATVNTRTNHGTYTTYTATLSAGSVNTTYRAGTAVVDYGPSGTGFITLSADGTVGASPNLTMAKHAGSPWAAFTTLLRLGNLNGSYGYASDVYGLAVGQYGVSNDAWITIANSGTAATSGVRLGQNTTTYIQLKTDGSGYLANSLIAWDTSGNLNVTGNATIAGWTITPNALTTPGGYVKVAANDDLSITPGAWFGRSPSGFYGVRLQDGFSNEIRMLIGDGSIYPYIGFIGAGVYRVVIGGLNGASFPGGPSSSMGLKIGDNSANLLVEFSSVRNTIAGWTITTTRIANAHVLIDNPGQFISLGSTPPTAYNTAAGLYFEGANGGRVSWYSDVNNYLLWDSSKLIIKAQNFTLDASGNLTATSATLSGAITATSGSITGNVTITGSLTAASGNVLLDANGLTLAPTSTLAYFRFQSAGQTTLEFRGADGDNIIQSKGRTGGSFSQAARLILSALDQAGSHSASFHVTSTATAASAGVYNIDGFVIGGNGSSPGAMIDLRLASDGPAFIGRGPSSAGRFELDFNSDGSWSMWDCSGGTWAKGITHKGGNVGVNTTNPSNAKLHVVGAANNNTFYAKADTTTGQSFGAVVDAGTNASDSALLVRAANSTTTYFAIRGDGFFSSYSTVNFAVFDGPSGSYLRLRNNSAESGYVGSAVSIGIPTATGLDTGLYSAANLHLYANNTLIFSGNLRLRTYGAGTLITDASGNVSASSDERLKFVEGEYTRGLAALRLAGRPVYYKMRPGFYTDDTSTRFVGWTTQRIAPGIPEAVMPGDPYDNLWDRAIHATMHNAILDLDTRDDALQSQITTLQNQVEQLTARVAALEAAAV